MRFTRIAVIAVCIARFAAADLTTDQKVSDFMQLSAQYAKNYAPYELKRDLFGFDLYNITPWLNQVKTSKTDLEFFDICTKYVASLQDSHDEFTTLSFFDAWLHFDGDIYDGKFLVDFVDRTYLTRAKYPFTTGDELVSVDGVAVADLVQRFQPYAVNGSSNPVSRARLAAALVTERYQAWYPLAPQIGATATVVVKRASTGANESYVITWDKSGTPVTTAGVLGSPAARTARAEARRGHTFGTVEPFYRKGLDSDNPKFDNPWGVQATAETPTDAPDTPAAYLQPLTALRQGLAFTKKSVGFTKVSGLSPFENIFPNWNPPSDFVTRLGLRSSDYFLTGTFGVGNSKVGYIRIPTMFPASETAAYNQYVKEIAYMQANTDGLVIDVMANGGGDGCYTEALVQYLATSKFRALSQEIRATLNWQYQFDYSVLYAQAVGAPPYQVALLQQYLNDVKTALTQNRARTGNLPTCGVSFDVSPAQDAKGNLLSYTKPILVLQDNFTLSAAEIFTMMLQDAGRATVFGTRSAGGGGSVVDFPNATAFSEGDVRITESLVTRAAPAKVPGYPSMTYYDGVGIQPDIIQDFQTADNLATGGVSFVKAFSTAIGNLISASKGK